MSRGCWACSVLLLGCASLAEAAVYKVSKTSDTFDGTCNADCSLRDAIAAANASADADTIYLRPGFYKIQRPTPPDPSTEDGIGDEDGNAVGDFDLSGSLVIKGDRDDPATIDAAGRERLFEVLPGADVELRDLQLRNGYTPNLGGGVFNAGTLKLTRVQLKYNKAASGFDLGRGGGAANTGTLSVADSLFQSNQARGGEASYGEGGGIYNTGTLHVRTTRFVGNVTSDDNDSGGGGGIMNRGGRAVIERAYFRGNGTSSAGAGGAVANRGGGTLTLVNATVSGNTSGEPGLWGGGAVANGDRSGDAGLMSIRFSTIAENDGGGVLNSGRLRWYDTLVVGNYENYGGDTRDYAAGVNCVNLGDASGAGLVLGLDGNCVGNSNFDNTTAFDKLLYPLHYNGGFAPTYMPKADGGWVIDMASGEVPCPATDMRGAVRPFDADGDGQARCDIGAFEMEAPIP